MKRGLKVSGGATTTQWFAEQLNARVAKFRFFSAEKGFNFEHLPTPFFNSL
jgi:hypothetical protein